MRKFFISGIFNWLYKPRNAKRGKVYFPKALGIIGAVTSLFFMILFIITAYLNQPIWIPIIFLCFSIFATSLIVAFVNCRISYDDNSFSAKNFLGVKRKFTYDQVTGIKQNTNETYIYIGNRRVMVDDFAVGGYGFIDKVRDKYGELHDGEFLPEVYKTKHDIFNGNVKDSGNFLFVYIMMGVVAVGLLIGSICYTYLPSNESNTIKKTIRFVYCKEKDDEITLRSEGHKVYKIRFIDEQFKPDGIAEICDGQTPVTVYSKEVTPKNDDAYFSVKAIVHNGEYLVSFDETNRLHSQEYDILIIIPLLICVLVGAVIVFSIRIGRNPQKYSKSVVRQFFKDGYVRY